MGDHAVGPARAKAPLPGEAVYPAFFRAKLAVFEDR